MSINKGFVAISATKQIHLLETDIVSTLESIIKKWFVEEYDVRNAKGRITAMTFDGKKLFESYCNVNRVANPDNYISALCLRLTQIGKPAYPLASSPHFDGIRSALKDNEITSVIYIDEPIDASMDNSLRYICENFER